MPSTPPSWRALELTADAVAYRPAGTVASPPPAATISVEPTPIPLAICAGSHWPRKSGRTPTFAAYQTKAAAHTNAPGTTTARGPKRSASLPQGRATTAATTAPGATARPETSRE
jgi:hypothetical protein